MSIANAHRRIGRAWRKRHIKSWEALAGPLPRDCRHSGQVCYLVQEATELRAKNSGAIASVQTAEALRQVQRSPHQRGTHSVRQETLQVFTIEPGTLPRMSGASPASEAGAWPFRAECCRSSWVRGLRQH